MFNLKEYLERVKTEVTDPILEYMQEAEIDDFTAGDVARCGALLGEYLTALSELREPEDADIAFPKSIFRYLFMIFATMSNPPEDAFLENKIARPTPTTSM